MLPCLLSNGAGGYYVGASIFFCAYYDSRSTCVVHAIKMANGRRVTPPLSLCSADWQAVGPPHKQRYLSYRGQPKQPGDAAAAAATSAGGLLAAAKAALFESGAFARLLKAMIDVEILKHAGEVRRFRAGGVQYSHVA
jgi:hypothetical protein